MKEPKDVSRQHCPQWIYIDNVVNYQIFGEVFCLQDNWGKNLLYSIRNLEKGHNILFTPWDLDASLGALPVETFTEPMIPNGTLSGNIAPRKTACISLFCSIIPLSIKLDCGIVGIC